MRYDQARAGGKMARILFMLAISAAVAVQARAESQTEESAAKVSSALETLDSWLNSSANGSGWRDYLKTEQLRAQLAKGDEADPVAIVAIISQYQSGAAGLNRRRFVAVRRALDDWLEELVSQRPENLDALIRSTTERFSAPTQGQIQTARGEIDRATAALDRFLGRDPARGSGWRSYLSWDVLQEQLAADSPGMSILEGIAKKFASGEDGLGMAPFKNVRRALRRYIDHQFAAQHPDKVKERLAGFAESLAAQLADYGPEATHRDALEMSGRLRFIERYARAELLSRHVRRQFSHPNLAAYASQDLLNSAFGREVNEPNRVRDTIVGTYIAGHGVTRGQVQLSLVPSPDRAVFDLSMHGVNNAQTTGYVRSVQVHSHSTTQLSAQKRLQFSPETGLTSLPSSVWAATQTNINNITTSSRFDKMVKKIAWKRAGQQKSEAEHEATGKARTRLQQQFDNQVADLVRQANDRYQNKLRRPMIRKDLFPEFVQVTSSSDAISVLALKALDDQLAAPAPAGAMPEGHDVALRVHESMINNMMAGLLGGRTLTNEDASKADDSKAIERLRELGKVHNYNKPDKDDEAPWEITLAKRNPVTIEFRDGQIKATVRGTRFVGIDEKVYDRPMSVHVTLKPSHGPGGALLLTLESWDVEPTTVETGGKFTPADAPLRSKLRARLKSQLGESERKDKVRVELFPIKPKDAMSRIGTLVYTLCESNKGWLTMAINRASMPGAMPVVDATAAGVPAAPTAVR